MSDRAEMMPRGDSQSRLSDPTGLRAAAEQVFKDMDWCHAKIRELEAENAQLRAEVAQTMADAQKLVRERDQAWAEVERLKSSLTFQPIAYSSAARELK